MTYTLPAGQVRQRYGLLKLRVLDVSRFVHSLQLLEEVERHELGTVGIRDPVARIVVIELVQSEIVLASVQRLGNRTQEHDVIEQDVGIGRPVQQSAFA